MQRGIILILCASFLSLPFLNGSGTEASVKFDNDDDEFTLIDLDDIPVGFEETLGIPVLNETDDGQGQPLARTTSIRPETSVPVASIFNHRLLKLNENYFEKQQQQQQQVQDEIINPNADAEGRKGFINHNFICYMSAFVTAAYNVRLIREAVLNAEPETASAFMLAEVFAKMQISTEPISTIDDLMPAVKREFTNWAFGRFQCNFEFAAKFIENLPKSVRDIFAMENRQNFFRADNGVFLNSKVTSEVFYQVVNLFFPSVSEAIRQKFPDREQSSYIIDQSNYDEYLNSVPEYNGTKMEIQTINETEIIDRPAVMLIGIPRTFPDETYNDNKVELDFELEMPALPRQRVDGEECKGEDMEEPVKYILSGFCYYVPGHYMSYVRDFSKGTPEGDWYKYNDQYVSAVRTRSDYDELRHNADTGATFAFYIRSDMIGGNSLPVVVPERYMRIAKLQLALEEVQKMKAQRRREQTYSSSSSGRYFNGGDSSSSRRSPSPAKSEPSRAASPVAFSPFLPESKRNENLPSPTNKRALKEFPLTDFLPVPEA